ncbi:MAG: alpha/beta hydrolase [Thaumarchaeota archaeon]|nr:alpha/beta hydrolase [Nitrososphaerota archaeon]
MTQQTIQENNTMNTNNYFGIAPKAKAFLESIPGGDPKIFTLSVKDARAVLSNAQSGVNVTKLPADIKDLTIPVGSKGSVDIRIIRPAGNNDTLPVVMYFHGGGWVLGDKDTHDRLVREIANGAKAAVVFVNYDRSPEAQYPILTDEGYAATKWVAENAKTINVDPSRIAVAGDSVGGNLASVVTMLAKESGGPSIIFQVLFYPVTDANFDTGSYLQFQTGYFLTRDAMKWFWNSYAPDQTVWKDPHVSPLHASLDQLKGLPPALVITDENDVLRDEGEAYAHKLSDAGVTVTATRYLGTIHDFVMLNAITDDPAPRAAIKQANDMLQQAFAK